MATPDRRNSRKAITDKLAVVLASSYTLLIKTHGYHWNVRGPSFQSLHELFGAQYTEYFAAVDEIAERIRALGVEAPGSASAFVKASIVKEAGAEPPGWKTMVGDLAKDNEALSTLASELRAVADEAGDTATGDLMNGRIAVHDKNAWMLRAHLD
jgi:starvation-inducible DNA-binding protein